MRQLRVSGGLKYIRLDEASEVSSFDIPSAELGGGKYHGFEFFRGLGIIGYDKTFKIWLRKFPRPIFIVAAEGRKVVSWVFIEEWSEPTKDGSSAYVLRAVETLHAYRSKRIAYRLLLLGLQNSVGHMLTKPLTPEAKYFFKSMGFLEVHDMNKSPIDMSKHPGYLILPTFKKAQILSKIDDYFKF